MNIVRLGKELADLCVFANARSRFSADLDELARKCKENLLKNLSLNIDNQTNSLALNVRA